MPVDIIRKIPVLAKIDSITLDASITETHTFETEVTQFPVENGATITDHIFNKPIKLSMHGLVSNSPLFETDESNRAQSAFKKLIDIRDKKDTITIITGLQDYREMVLTSLSIPRNVQTVESLEFTAEFTQIKIVDSQKVPISSLSNAYNTNKKAAKKIDTGKQTAQQVPELIVKDVMLQVRQSAPASSTYVRIPGLGG